METEVKLTKLAQCAGCGAKVGAGTLAKLLDGIPTRSDERLLVGFDKSDDASVYKIDENTALVQTLDFFPPIVDDPEMFGEIAAVNAISDIYAMGADPKLALNIMCVTKDMPKESIQAILRGGYKKAYEAGVIITGGCMVGVGILVAFIGIKIARLYKKYCWDIITILVTFISMAIAIYFGDWIKTVLPFDRLFFLLLVQVIYVGIRWYVKGWRETRGYY